ncbi:putative Acetyl-CoA synthetase (ADP-forming) alpha and beta chains [Desulfurella amilsii]|uniref:Putative Acetyl-CoA synthetase (ADP-forming) alpha and beta chains n=1 Tax=Desulfurella amilsii TaxID=1562698 RepID=A0A1X4XXD8_9BACT|nr:GNAT family N-acetyltransferase [Desulfurella amilsii]OSS42199.1 putative Acetyl-CoA synthetase (ADP-forming) alpha and beta chains [Desulfurella amilsii]
MKKQILKDGTLCSIRKVKVTEKEKIRELFLQTSPESRYYRFFGAINHLDDKLLDSMVKNDAYNVSLVCIVKDNIVGIANYYSANYDLQSAEVSFLVKDEFQGRGIGTLLLEELAKHAWLRGIKELEAIVLADNCNMIGVFKNSGFELVHERLDLSTTHLKLPLAKFNKVMSLHLLREKLATQASLLSAFNPKKIVYVGNECALWYNIYQSRKDAILFTQSSDILEKIRNEKPDLLVINVIDCKNLLYLLELDSIKVLIITTKLNEPIKSEVVSLIKKQGIRLIGPNSTGLFYNTLDNKINISPIALPKEGRLAIATHSNLLGISLVGYFGYIGLGVGCFVSVGDKIDVSGNDLLYFWQDDNNIDIIVLYLDSFGDPITFSLLARKISKQKPIFAVKSGRTLLSLGASRHEGFIFSNTDFTVEGLFKQTGIIRAETLEELLDDVLLAYACDFLSDSNDVSIVSNSVGANLMAIDTFEANNLTLDRVVYIEEPNIELYKNALFDVLSNSKSYYIEVIFAPPQEISYEFLDNFLNEILYTVNSIEHNKTVVVNVLSYLQNKNRVLKKDGLKKKIAVFAFVERSLRALGKLIWYANYKQKSEIYPQDLQNFNIKEARNYIRELLTSMKTYQLTQIEVGSFFGMLGIKGIKIEEEGLYNISMGAAYDKLFGAIMGISYYLYGVNIAYESPIVRVLPLTLLDIEEVINLIDKKNKLKMHTREKLSDLFIRLSEAFLHIPEIKQLDLPNLVVSTDGFYYAKAIIKAKKDDANLRSFTINF